jgi:Tfp pilus assembly protein PilO
MDFLNVGGWDLFVAALVFLTALAALAGMGVALVLRNRGPVA